MHDPEDVAAVERAARHVRSLLEHPLNLAARPGAEMRALSKQLGTLYDASYTLHNRLIQLTRESDPLPEATQRLVSSLVAPLSKLAVDAAAAASSRAAALPPPALCTCQLAAASTAFLLMRALLLALNRGLLQVGEADAMRLCTAASTPLHSQPRALPAGLLPAAVGGVPTIITVAGEGSELGSSCIQELMSALNAAEGDGEAPVWLPRRVAAALRASMARPDRLLAWVQRTVAEAAALIQTGQGPSVLARTRLFVALASVGEQREVAELLADQPAEQQAALVRLLAAGLQARAATFGDPHSRGDLPSISKLLCVHALRQGRLLHEQQTGGALLDSTVQLLQQLPSLLKGDSSHSEANAGSSAAQDSSSGGATRRGSSGGGSRDGSSSWPPHLTVWAAVRLLAALIEDMCEQMQASQGSAGQQEGTASKVSADGSQGSAEQREESGASEGSDSGSLQPVQLSPAVGQLLTGGGPLALYAVLELVAAAGPGATAAGQPGPPSHAPPALQELWSSSSFFLALQQLAIACNWLDGLMWRAAELPAGVSCAQAAAAVELLLRLAALMPAMPALLPGDPEVAPVAAMAVPARPEAETDEAPERNPAHVLAARAASLAYDLGQLALRRVLELPGSAAGRGEEELQAAALPAFHAAMTACRYEWAAAAGQLLPGYSGAEVLHGTCLLAYSIHTALLERAQEEAPHDRISLRRRLECLAVCHAEALQARHPALLGGPDSAAPLLMAGLEKLFLEPEVAEHWLASSMGTSAMLAGAADVLSSTLETIAMLEQEGPTNRDSQDLLRAITPL